MFYLIKNLFSFDNSNNNEKHRINFLCSQLFLKEFIKMEIEVKLNDFSWSKNNC